MAERYLFFNSTQTDRRRYQANDMAEYWASFLTSGLIHEDGQPQLSITANGINRIITVNAGRALLQGHLYLNDETMLKIEEPDALFDRIDRIVIRYDNSIENRYIKAFVKKGVVNENPIAPGLTRENDIYEISLAQIKIVGGKSFIEQADITDERLDTNLCGLASSLVKVPTNIFDEQFKAYMAQIADEWRSWYSSVIDASYITGETFAEHNRQVDRQLANLNAIADIDNRAIGNTGKFYDLFDGSNDMSVAKLDTNNIQSLYKKNVGDNNIVLKGESPFKIGEEVTIYFTRDSLGSNLESIEAKVTNVNKNIISIDSDLPMNAGALLARSAINEVKIESWASPKTTMSTVNGTIPSGTSSAITGLTAIANSSSSQGSTVKITGDNVEIVSSGSASAYPIVSTSGLFVLSGYSGASATSDTTVSTKFSYYNSTGVKAQNFISKSIQQTLSGAVLDHQKIDDVNYFLYPVGASSTISWTLSIGTLDETTGTVNIKKSITITTQEGNTRIAQAIAMFNNKLTNKIDIFYFPHGLGMQKFSVDKELTKVLQGTITNSFNLTIVPNGALNVNGGTRHQNSTRQFAIYSSITAGSSPHLLIVYINKNGEMVAEKLQNADGTLTFGIALHPSISQDGTMLIIDGVLYYLDDNFKVSKIVNLNEINANITSIANKGWIFIKDEILLRNINTSSPIAILRPISKFDIELDVFRYKIEKPTKNLAGWILLKESTTNATVSLSQVDNNSPEEYLNLRMSNNTKEIEFLQVENIHSKDKSTLKISIERNKIEKLLGAIE